MKMEPDKKYKIAEEQQETPLGPGLLQALIDDLDEILAESSAAGRLIHKTNDRAFDLMRKIIAIKKSNENTKETGRKA